MAVVVLHIHKYGNKKVTMIFKSGELHDRHVAATWKLGNHLNICLYPLTLLTKLKTGKLHKTSPLIIITLHTKYG